jgi:beta-glucosidase
MRLSISSTLLAFAMAGSVSSAVVPAMGAAGKSSVEANPEMWPRATTPSAISDATTEAMISATIARMNLEQKVGQLIQADISAIKPEDLEKYPLGSILAGGNSGPYGNERASAEQWAQLVAEFRDASRQAGAGIPILFGVDAVHGHSNLSGATIFPHNIGLGAARDADLVERIGVATAAEISDLCPDACRSAGPALGPDL